MPVEIVRSARRKRTVQAQVVAGVIRVLVPEGLPQDEERRLVDDLVARVRRGMEAGKTDLAARARRLARRYGLPQPVEIAWSERQSLRWGSCSPSSSRIRISTRLASVPGFVLDFVILHELAHLKISGHGPEFDALIGRYEMAERARGYLLALNQLGYASPLSPGAERPLLTTPPPR